MSDATTAYPRPKRIATASAFRAAWEASGVDAWLRSPATIDGWLASAAAGGEVYFPDGAVLILDRVGNVRPLR